MPALSFSKENSEHNSQAFQKAQRGGGVSTLPTGTPTLQLSEQVTLIPRNVTVFTFKQPWNVPVKTGDKEGKYKEVENNK